VMIGFCIVLWGHSGGNWTDGGAHICALGRTPVCAAIAVEIASRIA